MIKVNATKEYTYFFEDQEEELIQNYMEEHQVDAFTAVLDLLDTFELDFDTCYEEEGDTTINRVEKI